MARATSAKVDAALTAREVRLEICGDWQIRVSGDRGLGPVLLTLSPPSLRQVFAEPCDPMPVFNPEAGGWVKGYRLKQVRTQETTAKDSLVPESLVLRTGPEADAPLLQAGTDYMVDLEWGTVGWAGNAGAVTGRLAFASYTHGVSRIDSIFATAGGRINIREGELHITAPRPPALKKGEVLLANVWLPVRVARLTPDHLFPVLETSYPVKPARGGAVAKNRIPNTYAKLLNGEPLAILAWGDSVTDGSFLPDPSDRWQEQFVRRLRERFPKASITLITEAWGGRNTDSYRAEPPGSIHNYREKVLAVKPDLIVSEFVNDGWMTSEQTHARYGVILEEIMGIGSEWIILTPHYILPAWMGSGWVGAARQRDIDDDPRAYVKGLRTFADANNLALADASLRWGRLWRQGIPYMTLMLNAINHPDARGMRMFADSLMALF